MPTFRSNDAAPGELLQLSAGVRETPDGRTVVNPEEITPGDEVSPYADTLRPEEMADTDPAPTLPSP